MCLFPHNKFNVFLIRFNVAIDISQVERQILARILALTHKNPRHLNYVFLMEPQGVKIVLEPDDNEADSVNGLFHFFSFGRGESDGNGLYLIFFFDFFRPVKLHAQCLYYCKLH